MNSEESNPQPKMTTIAGRPSNVGRLKTTRGVYVQCRLATGEDALVPLSDIFALFELEFKRNNRLPPGPINPTLK